jgi:hypothetical protein
MSIKNLEPKNKSLPREIQKQYELSDQCSQFECKQKATNMDFCEEHYNHFKFGIIKKNGELAPDYEKKLENYASHQKRKKAA